MTAKSRFFTLHLALLLCFATGATSIFAIHSFGSAVPVINGKVGLKTLPPTWEAAVPSHGKHYRWVLKENHSLAYDCSFIGLVMSIVGLGVVDKKIRLFQYEHSFGIQDYRYADLAVGIAFSLFLYVGSLFFPSY